jgi:hypothetical protein
VVQNKLVGALATYSPVLLGTVVIVALVLALVTALGERAAAWSWRQDNWC